MEELVVLRESGVTHLTERLNAKSAVDHPKGNRAKQTQFSRFWPENED